MQNEKVEALGENGVDLCEKRKSLNEIHSQIQTLCEGLRGEMERQNIVDNLTGRHNEFLRQIDSFQTSTNKKEEEIIKLKSLLLDRGSEIKVLKVEV